MEQDEAAELRAALARAGIEVEVPTGWPALQDPHGDEAFAAYVERAVFNNAIVQALAGVARQGGGAPHNRLGSIRVAGVSVATLGLKWPRDMPEGYAPPAYLRPHPSPNPPSRVKSGMEARRLDPAAKYELDRLSPATQAALYQGERALRLLLGALLDAVRAGRIEMLHLAPGGIAHVPVPGPWLNEQGLVVSLTRGVLGPADAETACGLPRFMVLRLRAAAATVAPVQAAGAPAPAPAKVRLTYGELVAELRGIAEKSPDVRSHTRGQLWELVRVRSSEKLFREALPEAFEAFPVWQKFGRRKLQ
jgi:hypothetical protein